MERLAAKSAVGFGRIAFSMEYDKLLFIENKHIESK